MIIEWITGGLHAFENRGSGCRIGAEPDYFCNRANCGEMLPYHHGRVCIGDSVRSRSRDLRVGRCSPLRYHGLNKKELPVRHVPSTMESRARARAGVAAVPREQHSLMRGLAHGVILSIFVWMAAGYLTFALR